MGTRNLRIRRKDFDSHWGDLAGKNLHVVLTDGTTVSGLVVRAEKDEIVLRDSNSAWYNRKKHTHIIARNSILEIILDLVSPY